MAKDKKKTEKPDALALIERDEEDAERDDYRVKLEIFEGPLDLLLHLIRKHEVDIYDIPIAQITAQYLAYIQQLENLNINVAGDFLVMAATLIYIKSKMLLPVDPKKKVEDLLEEDPRLELVERLLEYQKFKDAATMLHTRSQIEAACYTRAPLETDKNNPEVSATVFDLLKVFREILARAEEVSEMEIQRDEMTQAEKLGQIRQIIARHHEFNVREIFELAQSKRELILTFLVLLQMVKDQEIRLIQSETYGDIMARQRPAEERYELFTSDIPPVPDAESGPDSMAVDAADLAGKADDTSDEAAGDELTDAMLSISSELRDSSESADLRIAIQATEAGVVEEIATQFEEVTTT
jgi:segregation and condensation protein A